MHSADSFAAYRRCDDVGGGGAGINCVPYQQVNETESEVVDMAVHLGLSSVTASNQLSEAQLWIVEKALEAPLPDGWSEHDDGQGRVYYYHAALQRSSWDHPMDEQFRGMIAATVGQRRNEKVNHSELEAALNSALTPAKARVKAPNVGSEREQQSGMIAPVGDGGSRELAADARDETTRRAAVHTPDIISPILTLRSIAKVKKVLKVPEERAAGIVRVAKALDINCMQEPGLLWIAVQGLDAPLPDGWKQTMADALPVYLHAESGTVINEHPLFPQLRRLVTKMRQEALLALGKHTQDATIKDGISDSPQRRRRFSDSDGLEDSHKSTGGIFDSSGDLSDSWSDDDEDDHWGTIAEYRGKLWKRQTEGPSLPEGIPKSKLRDSFRKSDGLISRLGSTLHEASHSAAKLTKSLSLDRPRTSLPVGVCNLGTLPKSRSSIVQRDRRQETSQSFSGRLPGIKRREDVYRIDSAMEGNELSSNIAKVPTPSASSSSGAKMFALPHFPAKAGRAEGEGRQLPQLSRSQSRV